ncbi:hypothetical protein ALC60_05265 [Trachymyrmex zeteki]|uniref:Uncharacterized protein n=1 Tax=Mycetomoellerius zeteki TaxID=64791 RepID=A0A151X6C5_9HYME|nr:hypothetical protein ALC60_05265 [Trachymyrmex zeteki]
MDQNPPYTPTGVSYGTTLNILHDNLGMKKLAARWVPRLLTLARAVVLEGYPEKGITPEQLTLFRGAVLAEMEGIQEGPLPRWNRLILESSARKLRERDSKLCYGIEKVTVKVTRSQSGEGDKEEPRSKN